MSWYYPRYEPAPPRTVKNGIKTRSQRGAIGETWWSKRWIKVLESLGMGARLDRGRAYARRGQVVSIDIQTGLVKAKVQGTQARPYSIVIRLEPLSEEIWEKVTGAMAEQAIFAAKLLAGEMPQNIEEAFAAVKVSLFPVKGKDLITDCSCPDFANPCKHIAAVYYILAERFDEDPFLIFKLRGRTKEDIIRALREKRNLKMESGPASETGAEAAEEKTEASLEASLAHFWEAGEALDSFVTDPALPEIEGALLKRRGRPPMAIGGTKTLARLLKAYTLAGRAARQTARGKALHPG